MASDESVGQLCVHAWCSEDTMLLQNLIKFVAGLEMVEKRGIIDRAVLTSENTGSMEMRQTVEIHCSCRNQAKGQVPPEPSWLSSCRQHFCLTWHPTFLLGGSSPDLKAGVQLPQHSSMEENPLASLCWWLSPGGVTEEGEGTGERAVAVRFQGSVTVQEKGWETAGLLVCCDMGREGVEKKLKYGVQEEAPGSLHHAVACPECRVWSRKPIGWTERERLHLAARKKAKYFRNLSFKVVSIFPKQHLFENQSISGFCLFANTQKGSLKNTNYFVFQQDGFFLALTAYVWILFLFWQPPIPSNLCHPRSHHIPCMLIHEGILILQDVRMHSAVILWERKIWKPLCSIFFCSRRNIPLRLQFQAIIGWNQ